MVERPDSVGPPHAGENQRRKKQLKLEKAAQDKEAAEKKERERIEKERGKVVTKLDEEELKLVRKKIVCKFYVEGELLGRRTGGAAFLSGSCRSYPL